MAFMHLNYYSPTLKYQTDLNVIIPTPDGDTDLMGMNPPDFFARGRKYQVLYLLHGTSGDCYDWLHKTNAERLAQQYRLAMVLPSCQNSFFCDMVSGPNYLKFLTQELPEFITKMFPVSVKRENTFIAGLSMGGYGAWHAALAAPDRFAAAASLSGVLDFPKGDIIETHVRELRSEIWPFRAILGERDFFEILNDPSISLPARIEELIEKKQELPKLFITVGTEDFTYQSNQQIREKLRKMNVSCGYTEGPGMHDWFYWGEHLRDVLEWLPLRGDTVPEAD